MKRRDFLKLTGIGAILSGCGIIFIPQVKQIIQITKTIASRYQMTNNAAVFNLHQVITSDITKSRTIMWQSKYNEPDAIVEYRIKDTTDIHAAKATDEEFTDDNTTSYIHFAAITDLHSLTAYEYRVGYGNKRSNWHDLSTNDNSNFKVIIFPDSQSNDYNVWRDTAQAAWNSNPDAQFFINIGDLVDNGEDHNQWNAWFDAIENMIQTIPAVPLLGNHETYTRNWKVRMPEAYLHLFALPEIMPKKYQNQYYSFDYGAVHFIVINTQIGEMEQFQPDMLSDELTWVENDIENTQKKWKIVLMHKDVLQYGFQNRPEPREEGFTDEGRRFMPLFDKYNVDVVLTGHLHTYRNRGHIRNFVRDESGPLYIITGVAGDVRYPGLWKQHSLDQTLAPQPETDNYMTMDASNNVLTFSSFLPNGELIDRVSVNKS
ncbi:metallophosphoesterase [Pectinatus frisingensis]|uniref:metallophosphoesterase n=1 Tax=Pectinatus frisingensis TaxID=865 RepID=UPI003D805242